MMVYLDQLTWVSIFPSEAIGEGWDAVIDNLTGAWVGGELQVSKEMKACVIKAKGEWCFLGENLFFQCSLTAYTSLVFLQDSHFMQKWKTDKEMIHFPLLCAKD